MITRIVHIADDGTAFLTTLECLKYEGFRMWDFEGNETNDANFACLVYFPNEEAIQYFCRWTDFENVFLPKAYYLYSIENEQWYEIDFIKDSELIDRIIEKNKQIRGH